MKWWFTKSFWWITCSILWLGCMLEHACGLLHLEISRENARGILNYFPEPELRGLEEKFTHFMTRFRKEYAHEEERMYRLAIFMQNWIRVQQWNNRSTHAPVYGITQFSDMSPKEFQSTFLTRTSRSKYQIDIKSSAMHYLPGHWGSPISDLIEKIVDKSKETIQKIVDKISGHPDGTDDDDGGQPDPIPDTGKVADLTSCAARLRFPELCESFGSIDWRSKGAVTEVKYQGTCGSCWSFGATSDLEGAWYLAGHRRVSLSEQQLVSCDKKDLGCEGGLQQNAFEYIKSVGGVMSEADYPYVSENSTEPMCRPSFGSFAATLEDWVQVSDVEHIGRSEQDIAKYVFRNGPVTIGINALPMQFYVGGIHDPFTFECPESELNHAVTIVGFQLDGPKPYWIVKNSWGTAWGEDGYYRLSMGKNACGVANDVVHSIVKSLAVPEIEHGVPSSLRLPLYDTSEKLRVQH